MNNNECDESALPAHNKTEILTYRRIYERYILQ